MSTAKKKETIIIQKQIAINTLIGRTPISPQSHSLLEIGQCSRAQPVLETEQTPQLSVRPSQQSTNDLQAQIRSKIIEAATSGALRAKSGKTLTSRGSKTGTGTKVGSQPGGTVQQRNSGSSLTGVKSLRSMDSLKSMPAPCSPSYAKSPTQAWGKQSNKLGGK